MLLNDSHIHIRMIHIYNHSDFSSASKYVLEDPHLILLPHESDHIICDTI